MPVRSVVLLILKVLGWSVAHTPEFVLRVFSAVLGDFIFTCLRSRRRLILSNLHHAFPARTEAWRRQIGRESCHRLIETALLSLATPYLQPDRLRTIVRPTPALLECFVLHEREPAATLICSPHLAYWEAQTSMSLFIPSAFPEFGTIFRPLDNPAADAFVKRSRERFGMRLLSRKDGFAEALKIMRRRGMVGVLFDQNAGMQGALTLLFDRVCSTTELPGVMAEKFAARVYGIYPIRRAFWRVDIGIDRIQHDNTSPSVTLGLNRWLEQKLASDDNICASWLWAHARWRNQDMPSRRLRLEAKRNLLAEDLAARNLAEAPRRTRVWIRLPNWLGDIVMALPLLRAIRASRPDAEITLVAKKQFAPLLQSWAVGDRIHILPAKGQPYWSAFAQLRAEHIDVWLLFTNSARGDLEAWLAGARQRFGILRRGKWRPLLTHAFRAPSEFDEREHHQLELWTNFLRHFGLNAEPDRSPLHAGSGRSGPFARIGLIPGSENNPEKRWPVDHWRALIAGLPAERFVVFGTANDLPIATQVAEGFGDRVENRAGKTDLPTYATELAACRALVTNDTGGMHLASALGVPMLVLFGPTNPVRTGPVFSGPTRLLQPPGAPSTGGASLAELRPETVIAALHDLRGLALPS